MSPTSFSFWGISECLRPIGLKFDLCQEFSLDPVIPIYSARPDQVKKALNYVHSAAMDKLGGKELELLIAILPDNNGSLYGMILGHSSICIIS